MKKCFIPVCPRQERLNGQIGLTMNHTVVTKPATGCLFACCQGRCGCGLGSVSPVVQPLFQEGLGWGSQGIPPCDLWAELRPQGGVRLGRMELVVPGKGAVLSGDPNCCREQ